MKGHYFGGSLCLRSVAIGAHAETDEARQRALMHAVLDQHGPVRAHQRAHTLADGERSKPGPSSRCRGPDPGAGERKIGNLSLPWRRVGRAAGLPPDIRTLILHKAGAALHNGKHS